MTYFTRSGHGMEDGLFLHCGLARASAWDRVMALLAGEMSMLAMDLPGHGQSEDWNPERDFAVQTCDMALGLLQGSAHVIGHSFGAYAALRLALDHPEMVRSVTMIEPVFFAAAKGPDPAGLAAHKRKAGRYMGALAAGDPVSAARGFTADWGDGRPWESLKPAQMDYIVDRMPLIKASEAALLDDSGAVMERLDELEVPLLLAAGDMSPPIVASVLDGIEEVQPDAIRVLLDGAGHMAPMTHPDEVSAVIGGFIASQPRSKPIN